MVAQPNIQDSQKKLEEKYLPKYLIYEVLDGVPIYYRGYKEVLNNSKKSADIIGYGGLHWYLFKYNSLFSKR